MAWPMGFNSMAGMNPMMMMGSGYAPMAGMSMMSPGMLGCGDTFMMTSALYPMVEMSMMASLMPQMGGCMPTMGGMMPMWPNSPMFGGSFMPTMGGMMPMWPNSPMSGGSFMPTTSGMMPMWPNSPGWNGLPGQPGMCECSAPAFPASAGNQASRAVQVAESQVGVTGCNPGQVCQYTQGRSEPWCADFVSWAYDRSGGSPFGHRAGVESIKQWGEEKHLYHDRGSYRPRPGDIVVFGADQHTGIVESVDRDGTVHTIEGNTNGYGMHGGRSANQGAVARHAYAANSSYLTGYVDMQKFQ